MNTPVRRRLAWLVGTLVLASSSGMAGKDDDKGKCEKRAVCGRVDALEQQARAQQRQIDALLQQVQSLSSRLSGANVCSAAQAPVCCPRGDTFCPLSGCTDTAADVNNCGACGQGCGARGDRCSAGACSCGGGAACTAGSACSGGQCFSCGQAAGSAMSSCKAIHDTCPTLGDGPYWIDPGGVTPFQAYCDMTTDGGGWTILFSSQTVQVQADFVTTETTNLATLAPGDAAGSTPSRASVYAWPLQVSQVGFECRNRLTSARHFYSWPFAAASGWPELKSCTGALCGRCYDGNSGVNAIADLAAPAGSQGVVGNGANWRFNLGGECESSIVDDFSIDDNWAPFWPNDLPGASASSPGNPMVAWGTGDGGYYEGRNRCAGVDLSTAGSQPIYSGAVPASPEQYTSDGYFYIWVR